MSSNDKIMYRLKRHLAAVKKEGFNEDKIFGIFLYGSQNYGTDTKDSDIDTYVIILPSFEDFCLSKIMISKEIYYKGHYGTAKDHINIKDIRLMREMFMKQNINFLEILYSDFYWINPKYLDLYEQYFIVNRDKISHYDRNKVFNSIKKQILQKLDKMKTRKELSDAYRLLFFLQDYLEGKDYLNCIRQKGESLRIILDIKTNPHYILNEEVCKLQIKNSIIELENKYPNLESPMHEIAGEAIDTGIIEILKKSFNANDETFRYYSKNDFFKELTNTETKAYESIVAEIGNEGYVTVSKLIDKYNISRPAYNNLFNKMKKNSVAQVLNKGMKGFYIKINV